MITPPIVKLISRYAKPTVYNDGRELAIPCPYHSHGRSTKKQLWININKRLFICYRCDESGTFRKLLATFRRVKAAAFADIPQDVLDALSAPVDDVQQPREHPGYKATLPEEFEPLWGKLEGKAALKARKYLEKRGLDEDTIELYRIGYCKFGDYASRVIVPTYEEGRLVYWLGRDFTGKQYLKVKNPAKALAGVGSKEWVFNLNVAEDFRDLIVCEGVFDAIATGLNAVALFGKTASEIQIAKIRRRTFRSITILLDADAPQDADRLADLLLRWKGNSIKNVCPEVRVARLPEGDPNSVAAEVRREAIKTAKVKAGF